jgi:hypothetical protein
MQKKIKRGVPQGSILRPILFYSYISDLLIKINETKIVLFADYTNIFVTAENK